MPDRRRRGRGVGIQGRASLLGQRHKIAHFEADDAIDLRLTRAQIRVRRAELRADPRVSLRGGSSDWLTVRFSSEQDEQFVCGLAEMAAAAHRPSDGSPARLPATGAALARRRRFH